MKQLYSFLSLLGTFLFSTGCANSQPTLLQSEFLFTDAPFAQCHASTIAEVNGTLLVAYFGGTHERNPDVSIYLQRKEQGGWSAPRKIADGVVNDTLRYPTWNPVLFFENDTLVLHYKMGPIKNKPIRTQRGTLLYPSSVEYVDGTWKAHIELSENASKTFSKIEIPSPDSIKVIQPTLLEIPNKGILALLRSNQNRVMQSWSEDDGKTWSAITPTDLLNPNSGIDAVATTSGKYLLVNNALESGASWEMGRNKLSLYASDDGKTWTQIMQLEDQESGEFSYPAIINGSDGYIHITYTYDRRNMKYLKIKI